MDGARWLTRLFGLLFLVGITGCHGRFFYPPPPGYAYGANPAVGGGYGPYGDCVNGGYAPYGDGTHGSSRQLLRDVRANMQERRHDRRANRAHRHLGHRRGLDRRGAAGYDDIGCDSYLDVGCDGSGMCDLSGSCDSCYGCEIDCCDPCMSCSGCACGCSGMMMSGTNPGPYVAYLIPMESYQGELCGDGMCFNGMSGCDSCVPGIIQGEVIDDGFIGGGNCASGDCQTYLGDDGGWQMTPSQLQSPAGLPSDGGLQPIPQRSQESLPGPPRPNESSVPEGSFEPSEPSSVDAAQTGYAPSQETFWVPNQF